MVGEDSDWGRLVGGRVRAGHKELENGGVRHGFLNFFNEVGRDGVLDAVVVLCEGLR